MRWRHDISDAIDTLTSGEPLDAEQAEALEEIGWDTDRDTDESSYP